MFYAIYVPPYREGEEEKPEADGLVFEDIKEANAALKRYKGSRMKIFPSRERALYFLQNPDTEESFLDLDSSCHDMVTSFEKLSVNQHSSPKSPAANNMTTGASLFASPIPPAVQQQKVASTPDDAEPAYPSAKPGMLNQLRRKIENGDYEAVEETIWSNPRCLVSVCDSAIYLMAGPKYNACHIAARANKPDIMALLLDTISNFSFLRKLYPNESDLSLQDRVNHLLDSYLNTPDPRQGNTPLHFAYSNGQTAEESICSQYKPPPVCMADQFKEKLNIHESGEHRQADGDGDGGGATIREPVVNSETQLNNVKQKIKNMFKQQFHLPLYRDQLKKRLILERRRSRASSQMDSDTSFSDIDDSFIISSPTKQNK